MMEVIEAQEGILAYCLQAIKEPRETMFPTPPEVELQVGFVVYPGGGVVAPHRHVPTTRNLSRTCEVIIVRSGRCEVDIYDSSERLVATRELASGDLIILVSGGHGFRMLEDTVLLEVKQGPYFGLEEKEYFR